MEQVLMAGGAANFRLVGIHINWIVSTATDVGRE